jgi:hypothetical protein
VSFCAAAAWLGRSGQTAELGLTVFDGTSWAAPAAEASFGRPAGPGLPDAAVSCPGTSFCLAVSGDGVYVTWNGSAWSAAAGLPTGPASGRSALSCASPALCLLADGSQNGTTGASMTKYAVWGGQRWSTPRTLENISLSSVSCTSASFCMGVGQMTTPHVNGISASDIASVWSGSSWSRPVDLGGAIGPLGDVSCRTASFCLLVGGYHASGDEFATWNGTRWSAESADRTGTGTGPAGFESVSCPAISLCVATDWGSGANGQPSTFGPPVISVWRAGAWSGTPEQALADLGPEVSCPTDRYCIVIGSISRPGQGSYLIGTS